MNSYKQTPKISIHIINLITGLLLAGQVYAADHWLATEAGCKVWSDQPQAPGELLSWSGACEAGKLSGAGELVVKHKGNPVLQFSGTMRGGKANGKGSLEVVTEAGPVRYEGGFRNSLLDGYGVLSLANGDRYEGGFQQDQPDGFGLYKGADGGLYQGDGTSCDDVVCEPVPTMSEWAKIGLVLALAALLMLIRVLYVESSARPRFL